MVTRVGGPAPPLEPQPESTGSRAAGFAGILDGIAASGETVRAPHLRTVIAAAHELFGAPKGFPAGHQVFGGRLPGGRNLELRIYGNPEISLFASVSGAGCAGACQMSLCHAAGDGLKLSPHHTSQDRDAAEVAANACHLVLAGAQRQLRMAEPHPQTFA